MDDPVFLQICLIGDQYLDNVLGGMVVDLLHPPLYFRPSLQIFQKVLVSVMEQTRMMPAAPLQQACVTFLNLSCPAVSHICNLILFSLTVMVLILKSTPIVAMQFGLKVFSQNRTKVLVLPTPQSPIMISLSTSSSFLACIYYYYMHKLKRDRLGKQARQNHHELIRQQIRESLLNRQNGTSPLVSDTLEMFCELSHAQLSQHSDSIAQAILSTNFSQLSDEEHMRVVTDIYYLIYQKIMPELSLRFKHNEDTYTATLVAFLSQQIEPEELIYWIPFMGEEEKSLMFLNIDGLSFSHKKWVLNQKLFQLLLQDIKWSSEAALAFKSILESSQQIQRKQIIQSIDYVHKALGNIGKEQHRQYFRQVLIRIWVTLILLCQNLKEGPRRLQSMILALKYELNLHPSLFLNEEILSDVIQLYINDQCLYLLEDPFSEEVLLFVYSRKVQLVLEEEVSNSGLYFNYLFQFLYKNWMARHLKDKPYRYSPRFYQILKKFEGRVENSPYFDKLWKIVSD